METWTPNYKVDPGKTKVVSQLKEASKKADEVLIATDPDREGEAIADNLVQFLNVEGKYRRIRFNEITQDAVQEAVAHPSDIDEHLVKSQIARRIIDRMIGYKLSGLMRKKISGSPMSPSAGRVQTIALKIIVEREKLIDAFVPVQYITVDAKISEDVVASLISGNYEGNKTWVNPADIEALKPSFKGSLKVDSIKVTQKKDARLVPFKASSLYKKADSSLGMSSRAVQSALQRLYEGYGDGGLISYPRTDSTRLSEGFIQKAQSFIRSKYGEDYIAYDIKGEAGKQDAHEAVRPTDLGLTPSRAETIFNLPPAEAKVYKLVYNHTLMSLMKTPNREILRYELSEGENQYKLSASKVIYDGYLKVTGYEKSKELPVYHEGEVIPVQDYLIDEHETKPPARYNDGSLIEVLENIGVGRPSTFVPTINTLKSRQYVELEGRAMKPTEFGKIVVDKLITAFPVILEETYTAKMETELDEIATGKHNYRRLLDEFWEDFEGKVATATQEIEPTKLEAVLVGKPCPECKNELVVRTNKRDGTKFFACSNFPQCKYTESDPNSKRPFRKWKKK